MRKSSILIYCIHPYFILLFQNTFAADNSIVNYIFTVLCSILFSAIVLKLENFKCLSWLKYLH